MISPAEMPYRPCVGIMLLNDAGSIWIGRRCKRIVEDPANWQMPQGGIDPDEDPSTAALRELAEETGTDKAHIIGESSLFHHYELPPELLGIALQGRFRGQRQKWFAMRFLGQDADFNIHHPLGGHEAEFDAWRWASAGEVIELITPFKRQVYLAVLDEFRHLTQTSA